MIFFPSIEQRIVPRLRAHGGQPSPSDQVTQVPLAGGLVVSIFRQTVFGLHITSMTLNILILEPSPLSTPTGLPSSNRPPISTPPPNTPHVLPRQPRERSRRLELS